MRIQELNGKNVLMLGYGREGQAMAQALKDHQIECNLTITEKYPDVQIIGIQHPLIHWAGPHVDAPKYLTDLTEFDMIIKSPGIPPNDELSELEKLGKLTSSTQIFLDTVMDAGAQVIGVTGTKGKSTTTSLIYAILKAASKDAHLVGNIGEPAIAHLDAANPGTIFVLEMSSYQLMSLTVSPHIAVVTNFYPEHLDYHGSLAAYRDAKQHICRFQTEDDAVFYSGDTQTALEVAQEGRGKKIAYHASESPVTIQETHLIGTHNLSNIAGAWRVAEYLGVDKETAVKAIKEFQGLPHRLQPLGTHHGITWIDDAISTTPQSTIAALDALGPTVQTIILGGKDRGIPFDDLGDRIANSQVTHVILFPGSGPRIRQAIQDSHASGVQFHEAEDMHQAVTVAKQVTSPGRTCLLSTASPSYGMFKDFQEKGEAFQREILA